MVRAIRDEGRGQLELDLSHGTFRLDVKELDGRFVALLDRLSVDQRSCSAQTTVSGRVPIVVGSGTGAYDKISGAFDLGLTLDEVYHPGACSETAPYLAQKIVMTGWGTVSVSHG